MTIQQVEKIHSLWNSRMAYTEYTSWMLQSWFTGLIVLLVVVVAGILFEVNQTSMQIFLWFVKM